MPTILEKTVGIDDFIVCPNPGGGFAVSVYLPAIYDPQGGNPNAGRLCHMRRSNKVRNDMAIRSNRVI